MRESRTGNRLQRLPAAIFIALRLRKNSTTERRPPPPTTMRTTCVKRGEPSGAAGCATEAMEEREDEEERTALEDDEETSITFISEDEEEERPWEEVSLLMGGVAMGRTGEDVLDEDAKTKTAGGGMQKILHASWSYSPSVHWPPTSLHSPWKTEGAAQ